MYQVSGSFSAQNVLGRRPPREERFLPYKEQMNKLSDPLSQRSPEQVVKA